MCKLLLEIDKPLYLLSLYINYKIINNQLKEAHSNQINNIPRCCLPSLCMFSAVCAVAGSKCAALASSECSSTSCHTNRKRLNDRNTFFLKNLERCRNISGGIISTCTTDADTDNPTTHCRSMPYTKQQDKRQHNKFYIFCAIWCNPRAQYSPEQKEEVVKCHILS